MAYLTRYIYIRQEVHGDHLDTVTLAGFAAPALDVEGEASLVIAAQLRFRRRREHITDIIEDPGIGGRIGPRGPADGILVDLHEFVEVFQALDLFELAGLYLGPAEVLLDRLHEHFVDQRALARPGHPGDQHQFAQREFHIDLLEVVLLCPGDVDAVAVAFAPLSRQRDQLLAGKILAGNGILRGHDFFRRAVGDDFAAVNAGARTDIDDPVG